jgi:hypothetical protein
MKLIEHVYAIRNLVSKGPSSDDASYSLRLIAHFLKVARAILTEQKADKYHYISEQSFQSLCLDLQEGNFHNCCEAPQTKCKLLKSTLPIPKFLNTRWGDFAKVMTLEGDVLSKTSLTLNTLSKYSLTNKKPKLGWFIHDQHLYIMNNKMLTQVILNSLFDDPEQVQNLNCANNEADCTDFMDQEFPMDPDLVDPMYKMVIQYLAHSMQFPPNDRENNANDDQT